MGHLHIGLAEFFVWVLFYIIWKAMIQVINVETRRMGMHVPAGVSGLLA